MEGRQNGVSVLIFDAVLGAKGGSGRTFIACQTEQNPFGIITSLDRVIQSHEWTVLYGVKFLLFTWPMGIQRLDHHMKKLRFGSVYELGS